MMILGLPISMNSPLAQTNPLARNQALSMCCEKKTKGWDWLIGSTRPKVTLMIFEANTHNGNVKAVKLQILGRATNQKYSR
jgi:hypothetical protein